MHLLAYLLFLSTTLAAPLLHAEPAATVVSGHYIVKIKQNEVSAAENGISTLTQSLSIPPKFEYSLDGFHGFAGQLSDIELDKLQASEYVEYIQPDMEIHAFSLVYQDPATWGLGRISHREPRNSMYIFDDSAGEGTCAYVIDTGIFVAHPDFEGRAEHLANFSDDESNEDDYGHGTHVAGTIGSRTFGVAKKTNIYSVKVLDSSGQGRSSSIIAGIAFVARDAASRTCPKGAVVNISLGGVKDTAINQAVAAAVASGVFIAVAAGNDGGDARYYSPASEPSACTVGATTSNDTMPSWSNSGPLVDILAPGVRITSLSIDGGTKEDDGTSMATPHVTGLAAYLLSLQGGGTNGLCERIAGMGTKDVVKNVKQGTVNTLINNGALG